MTAPRNPADPVQDAIDQEAADWFLESEQGLSSARQAELQRWLEADPRHGRALDGFRIAWDTMDAMVDAPEIAALREEARGLYEQAPGAVRLGRSWMPDTRWITALAASLVLTVAGGAWLMWHDGARPQDSQLAAQVFATRHGQTMSAHLADGSTLVLDTDSRVSVRYAPAQRTLVLEQGRAFFDVAHDPARPFVVSAGERRVTAVGTAFDVARDASTVRVVLARGRVRVEPEGAGNAGETHMLRPGEELVYARATRQTDIREVDAGLMTGWREGLLHFDAEPLGSVVATFNGYLSKPIRIADPALQDLRVSGVFRANAPADFVSALGAAFSIEAVDEPDAIVLRRTSQKAL